MISLLKKCSYQESVWKNGKGITQQIAIFPDNATVSANDFLWRISSAKVNQSDPFSHFPNCERQLIVWIGEGLILNGRPVLPHTPHTFSGEQNIHCDLLNGAPVVDLGIIYKKGLINATLEVHTFTTSAMIELSQGIHFLFLAQQQISDCIINGNNLEVGDMLKIENEEKLFISSPSPTLFYHINIVGT